MSEPPYSPTSGPADTGFEEVGADTEFETVMGVSIPPGEECEEAAAAMTAEMAAQHTLTSYDGMPGKRCVITDFNLFSGSADRFRNTVGGYYYNISDVSGNIAPHFYPFSKLMIELDLFGAEYYKKSKNIYFDSVLSLPLRNGIEVGGAPDVSGRLIPNKKFVVTVNGKPDMVKNDKFWKTLWIGGIFDDIAHDAVFSNNVVKVVCYNPSFWRSFPFS